MSKHTCIFFRCIHTLFILNDLYHQLVYKYLSSLSVLALICTSTYMVTNKKNRQNIVLKKFRFFIIIWEGGGVGINPNYMNPLGLSQTFGWYMCWGFSNIYQTFERKICLKYLSTCLINIWEKIKTFTNVYETFGNQCLAHFHVLYI